MVSANCYVFLVIHEEEEVLQLGAAAQWRLLGCESAAGVETPNPELRFFLRSVNETVRPSKYEAAVWFARRSKVADLDVHGHHGSATRPRRFSQANLETEGLYHGRPTNIISNLFGAALLRGGSYLVNGTLSMGKSRGGIVPPITDIIKVLL